MALNKDKIAGQALAIIEKSGLESLTMRRLASELGVKAASLYNHIKNKNDLYDLIQAFTYSKKEHLEFNGDWKSHLKELVLGMYDALIQHPKLLPLFATRPVLSDDSLKQIDTTLTGLVSAGFSLADALEAFHHVHVYGLGFALAEVGQPPGTNDKYQEPSFKDISLDKYEQLEQAKQQLAKRSSRESFILGLDCMLEGIATKQHIRSNV